MNKFYPNIFLRHIFRGKVWSILPVNILHISSSFVIIRISCGTRWLSAGNHNGKRIRIDNINHWQLVNCEWTNYNMTYLIPFNHWNAFGLLTEPTTYKIKKIYINFQLPLVKSNWGFDTMDMELDLISNYSTSLNKQKWQLKDKERFYYLCFANVFSKEEISFIKNDLENATKNYLKFKHVLEYYSTIKINVNK